MVYLTVAGWSVQDKKERGKTLWPKFEFFFHSIICLKRLRKTRNQLSGWPPSESWVEAGTRQENGDAGLALLQEPSEGGGPLPSAWDWNTGNSRDALQADVVFLNITCNVQHSFSFTEQDSSSSKYSDLYPLQIPTAHRLIWGPRGFPHSRHSSTATVHQMRQWPLCSAAFLFRIL
jgi:hypothetical protein